MKVIKEITIQLIKDPYPGTLLCELCIFNDDDGCLFEYSINRPFDCGEGYFILKQSQTGLLT